MRRPVVLKPPYALAVFDRPTHTLRWLLAMLATLTMIATGCGSASAGSAAETNNEAPAVEQQQEQDAAPAEDATGSDIVATTVSGGQIDFGSLQGQDVVLWFWAPW